MSAQRLYKAEWVTDAEGNRDMSGVEWDNHYQAPVGWFEYAIGRWPLNTGPEFWPNGFKPFFWPSTDKIFRSRSSAQARVDIINRWGGKAVLVECTPRWETVEQANARRKAERLIERMERKSDELNVLSTELERLTAVVHG